MTRLKLNRKWRRRIIHSLLGLGIILLLVWFVLPFALPLPRGLLENPAASPVILDRHGKAILHLTLPDSSRANPVTLDQVPQDLITCTLAAEDKRFFSHGGVDLLATFRAARDMLLHRRVVSGASTITQQLIKISSPSAARSPFTKVREALMARRLEMTWSKQQILEAYLNRLDYGNLRTGCAEASRFYFQKPLADLSLAECALLSGLPQAPSRLNPLKHPQRAVVRRNTVIQRLSSQNIYPPARLQAARQEKLSLRPLREENPAPWLANRTPGIEGKIITTLDLTLQREVERIVKEETSRLKQANLHHAAVVVIHNATGEILALVSSADWNDLRGGQMNGAWVPRSPGSTLKPFTYLLAMEKNQRTPASILADVPSPFRTPQGLSLPENYDRAYRGPVTLRAALACSLNVPALREMNELGGPSALHDLLQSLGLTTLGENPAHYGLGLTLGNAPVRLVELTSAYAALARMGDYFPAVLFPPSLQQTSQRILPSTSCWLIADILSDSNARAPSFQPGGPLDLPFKCAVKTGTSSDFHDNWCIGYTPEFTVGVWAGNFEHQPMKGLSGVDGAAPIFHRTLVRAHANTPATWYPRPEGLSDVMIDPRNGKLAIQRDLAKAKPDIVPMNRIPQAATSCDYDSQGRALLDPVFASWFNSNQNRRRNELALDAPSAAREALRIISPTNGSTYVLDPEIPSGSNRLRPVTNLPGTARWHSDTLLIEPGNPEPIIHLQPGTHTITATDHLTNSTIQITIHVKSL